MFFNVALGLYRLSWSGCRSGEGRFHRRHWQHHDHGTDRFRGCDHQQHPDWWRSLTGLQLSVLYHAGHGDNEPTRVPLTAARFGVQQSCLRVCDRQLQDHVQRRQSGAPLSMGNLFSTNYTNDTFVGGDFTNSGNDVTVLPSGAILVTLDFTRATAIPPSVGDKFLVTMGTDPNFNYFQDAAGDSIPFSSNTGVITIGAAAVPEPSSLVLMLISVGGLVSAGLGVRFARRGRKA